MGQARGLEKRREMETGGTRMELLYDRILTLSQENWA
jgi:hypothetical protein